MIPLITILGPTACGKTALAVALADRLGGEIISADSRQVFRGMDIGTGKDLADYCIDGRQIPYHLVDIRDAGEEYNIFQFQNDFIAAFNDIVARGKQPILCGGSGMYIDAIVRAYQLPDAPFSDDYRRRQESFSDEELTDRLASMIKLHNHTDTENRDRLLRALEINEYRQQQPDDYIRLPEMQHVIIGVAFPRDKVIERIGIRLRQRLDEGMVDEVQRLLDSGVPRERLLRYGLEYKHLTRFLTEKDYSYGQMFDNLYTDIRRFAKRQMTWFRRMERNGVNIHWVDGQKPMEEKITQIQEIFNSCTN